MNLHKILPLLLSISFVLVASSCDKVPETDFTYTPTENPEAGMAIEFKNTTEDASSFSWTFGEGGFSSVENPIYTYDAAGTYDVNLTATNDAGEQAKIKAITINEATGMGFFIYDSTGVNLLVGADVLLYDNESDLLNFGEPLLSGITDAEGKIFFMNLDPIIYYILVAKEGKGGLWGLLVWTGEAIPQNETIEIHLACDWYPDEAKSTHHFSDPAPLNLRAQ